MTDPEFRPLALAAADRYRASGRFAWHFARGKLLGDPVFEHVLASGALSASRRILDLGAGQGLLAALLLEAADAAEAGRWPARWPRAPRAHVHGIELMQADVDRARAALGERASFTTGNIASTAFEPCDGVVILDVLHYLNHDEQADILRRVRAALPEHGTLLLRIGDADGGFGFRWSNWVDHVVTWCRGHRLPRLYCRPLAGWTELLASTGFEVSVKPMSQGTLFANVLLHGEAR